MLGLRGVRLGLKDRACSTCRFAPSPKPRSSSSTRAAPEAEIMVPLVGSVCELQIIGTRRADPRRRVHGIGVAPGFRSAA